MAPMNPAEAKIETESEIPVSFLMQMEYPISLTL
jgi:hypothetical protein